MRDVLSLVIFLSFLMLNPSRAWLLQQTRRELFGVAWTTVVATTVAVDSNEELNRASNDDRTKSREAKEAQRQQKKEQEERNRIARETKARLAAGRIGTI